MSRSLSRIVAPSEVELVLSARLCSVFAPVLDRALDRQSGVVDPEFRLAVDRMKRVGECYAEGTSVTLREVVESESQVWTPEDAAPMLGIEPPAVRARCRRGTLEAELVNGRWLIPRRAVLDQVPSDD